MWPSDPIRAVSRTPQLQLPVMQRSKPAAHLKVAADCPCFSGDRKPIPLVSRNNTTGALSPETLLHREECDDPECLNLEQLKDLQKSLDRYTDYDHYERCCDQHHHPARHHHHLVRHGNTLYEECCDRVEVEDSCMDEPHVMPSGSYDDCEADCEECIEDHSDCFEQVDVCEEDCDQCEEECEQRGHDRDVCPQNHPTSRDNCLTGHDIPLPLLGPTNEFDLNQFAIALPEPTPCTDDCNMPILQTTGVDATMKETPFDTAMDHWQTFVQAHHCAPDPCLAGQPPVFPPQHVDPGFGFSFGSDPSILGNQYPWQKQAPQCTLPNIPPTRSGPSSMMMDASEPYSTGREASTPERSSLPSGPSSDEPTTPATNASDRVCQWIMPCGSICGASFVRTEGLKRHVKNSHGTKGIIACGWKDCSASFASEAALTGHISKKHLAFDEEGPWKCTFPNCNKSFMYKQVRDEHVTSHTGGNRKHCPICHQWLNAEGSNFRRHIASHGPKHEHMRCKYENLGCKRRFPRVDNLRRHEACCKHAKRAQGVHHHHHRIHNHTS